MKKWTPRQIARGQMSTAAFRKGLPQQEKEFCDSDYVDGLPEKAKLWMRTFEQEYYGGRFEKGGRQLHRGPLKTECYSRISRRRPSRVADIWDASAQSDEVLEEGGFNPESEYLDALDAEAFAAWKVKNSNSLKIAKALFKKLTKARNHLRLVQYTRALVAREKIMNRYADRPSKKGHSDDTDEAYLANRDSRLHEERLNSAKAWGVVASFSDVDADLS